MQFNLENEQEFHEFMKRNYCLKCKGLGTYIKDEYSNICMKCMGSGKRFQDQWLGGVIE